MGVRRGACWELLIGCGCCYPSRDWTIRKSCCWKQNPLNCETAAEYTGLCVRQKQACMYAAYETLHTCSFILYLPVIQSNDEHTRAQIHSWFGVSVRVRTNGVCVKHAWMNSLQRRSLFSVANRSAAARAKKTQSDASVTHMGHALHHASLPKLLQGHETQPKNAKRDTEEQVLL